MKILLAGATGAIGRPLIRCLKENGHTVFGLVRSSDSDSALVEMGAEAVTGDALDAPSVKAVIERIRPDAIINELTSLPRHYTPEEMKAAADRDRQSEPREISICWPRCMTPECAATSCSHRDSGMSPGAGLATEWRRLQLTRLPGSPPARVRMLSWNRLRSEHRRYNASLCVTDSSMGRVPGTPALAIWASRCANGMSRSSARARACGVSSI